LAPGTTQTLRVALRDWQQLTAEQAFRLYVHEVPSALNATSSGLQFALRVGVPVFASPQHAAPRLQWALESATDGQLTLSARNTGGRWAHVLRLEARAVDGGEILWRSNQAGYVIAGGERRWTGSTLARLHSGQKLDLLAVTEAGDLHDTVAVPP
jgi:fimbrial chaperone protein